MVVYKAKILDLFGMGSKQKYGAEFGSSGEYSKLGDPHMFNEGLHVNLTLCEA